MADRVWKGCGLITRAVPKLLRSKLDLDSSVPKVCRSKSTCYTRVLPYDGASLETAGRAKLWGRWCGMEKGSAQDFRDFGKPGQLRERQVSHFPTEHFVTQPREHASETLSNGGGTILAGCSTNARMSAIMDHLQDHRQYIRAQIGNDRQVFCAPLRIKN